MQTSEIIAIFIMVSLMIFMLVGIYLIFKNLNKNRKNDQRKEMVLELLEKHPDMSKDEILDLVEETIR